MKNLFDYATKEFSQDAFLCWLFANYNCENEIVSNVAVKLLSEFSFNLSVLKIHDLEVFKQWKYIDVLVRFKYDEQIICIAIEDKTYSEEHEQLKKYNTELKEYIDGILADGEKVQCYKVFYKTATIENSEYERVRDSDSWKIYDINKIFEFFSSYFDTGSEILDSYIEHVRKLNNIFNHYDSIPFKEWVGNNNIFKRYCDVNIKAKIENFNRSEIYQGKYTAVYIQRVVSNVVIELAFFFRDNALIAWIKCWENGKCHNEKNSALIEKIKTSIPNCLSAVWKRRVYLNRILITTKRPYEFNCFNDFDDWVNICIDDFKKIADSLKNEI